MRRLITLLAAVAALAIGVPALDAQGRTTPEQAARAYLTAVAGQQQLRADLTDLRLTSATRSLGGVYVRFQQMSGGVPVHGGEVVVTLDAALQPSSVQSAYVPNLPAPTAAPVLTPLTAAQTAMALLGQPQLAGQVSSTAIVFPVNGAARLAFRVVVPAVAPLGEWELMIDAQTGAVLSQRDQLVYKQGRVFSPNPVVTSGDTSLTDRNDKAYQKLKQESRLVELLRLLHKKRLIGEFCKATGKKNPKGRFKRHRNFDGFEQVNAYFHIDAMQAYIQSLGFQNVNNRRQVVKCNTISEDNSFYSPSSTEITFGAGGVDDAEDAEIVLHEYGHAVQYNQAPSWGAGHESRAMGEGFGDYLGGSYGAFVAPNPLFDPCVGEWDATSYSRANPPCLRRLDENKVYPQDLAGQVHADGEIWSQALWQIQQLIGRDDAHRVILESHFALPGNATMPMGAQALLNANTALRAAKDQAAILNVLQQRGLM